MSKYSIDSSTLMAIGDAIRNKTSKYIGGFDEPILEPFVDITIDTTIMEPTEINSSYVYYNVPINLSNYMDYPYLYFTYEYETNQKYYAYHAQCALYWPNSNSTYEFVALDCSELTKTSNGFITSKEPNPIARVMINASAYEKGATVIFKLKLWFCDSNKKFYKLNTYTPLEMANEINDLTILPPQAFNISGNCQYKFSFNGWEWFINGYKDKIKCENITNASNMFNGSSNFTFIPTINITAPTLDYTFQDCNKIREIIVNWINPSSTTTNAVNSTFSGCYSLRTINGLDSWPAICKGNSIFGLYNTFYNCWCLDELVDIPFVYSTYNGSYQFGNAFYNCYRLKRLVFKLPGTDESNTVPLKGATLDLTTTGFGGNKDNLTTYYNSGITVDKEVKDNATYQELKDDPDWFSLDVNYSRYNHDSAIETINSLPDCSATGTNTIKFKGTAGSLTDGGAINTLTEEEIAVASAKGWTVSFT